VDVVVYVPMAVMTTGLPAQFLGPFAVVITAATLSSLLVSFTLDGREMRDVRLTGDARLVYRGTTTAETTAGFDPDFVRDPSSAKVLSAE